MLSDWLSDARFRLRAILRRGALERELDEELRFHLEREARKYEREGASPAEAMRRARIALGGVERTKDESRDARGISWLDALAGDVRYALRGLARQPGFTAAVVLTLGLGIGANATMFGIVDRLLLSPPAYLASPARTHQVVLVRTFDGSEFPSPYTAYRRYLDFGQLTSSFEVLAAYMDPELAVGTGVDTREMPVQAVSASFWRLFDMRPVVGRVFGEAEDREPSGTQVAVLSYGYWRAQLGGRRDVVGSRVRIGSRDYTVIGVAARGFMGVSMRQPAAFVPITAGAVDLAGPPNRLQNYGWSRPEILVRRRDGVGAAAATADLTRAYRLSYAQQRIEMPGVTPIETVRPHAVVVPVRGERSPGQSDDSKITLWLVGVALVVLIIACANVGNLLLARASRRRREIAVRLALGVSRGRLLAQLLTESVLLAGFGGLAGLLLAQWGGGVLRAALLPDVEWTSTLGNPHVVAFAATVAVVSGILAGIAPVALAGRADVAESLKAGGREGTHRHSRTRTALLVLQGALSIVLLVGAGQFVRSLHNVRAARLGYDTDRLLYVAPVMRGLDLPAPLSDQLLDRLTERARTVPGVERSARTLSVPFYTSWNWPLAVPGLDTAYLYHIGNMLLQAVTPGYFATMGTRLLEGRDFAEGDAPGSPLVITVSRTLAAKLWPRREALGQCVKIGADTSPCRTVVAVAEDIKYEDLRSDPGLTYYIPAPQWQPGKGGVFVRTRDEASAQAEPVRRALQALMPGASYVTVTPFSDIVAPNMHQWTLGATMFSVFGVLALLVAAVGLYSVIAYTVAERTHELGIRIALGARTADVLGLVIGQGVRFAAAGILIGAVIAIAAGRWVRPLLFAESPYDPLVFAVTAAVLLGAAVAASLIPAVRAARMDPTIAFRIE
jgi:predicted permease